MALSMYVYMLTTQGLRCFVTEKDMTFETVLKLDGNGGSILFEPFGRRFALFSRYDIQPIK
jgi:hypothetical protein